MPATVPADIAKALAAGGPAPAGLSADEQHACDQLDFFYKHGLGYARRWRTARRRSTALADSPVGLAAWMLDHDARSYALIARVFDGQPEGLTRDDILDNVTLYWLTNTAVSSARLYWEKQARPSSTPKGVTIPIAGERLPGRDLRGAARAGRSRRIPNLIHYNRLDQGRPLRGLGTAAALLGRAARERSGRCAESELMPTGRRAPDRRRFGTRRPRDGQRVRIGAIGASEAGDRAPHSPR